MNISKSILSPARSRDPPTSLSTSLSRRLKTNGSTKGGASPMFPTRGKKNKGAFENPEPSSPKVTCIGQVRVKSKKKQQKGSKNLRSLSRRHSTGGEVSFRRFEQGHVGPRYQRQMSNVSVQDLMMPQRNQRWVHLPLTICEALRTIGSEFSCLFPCKSSCFSTSEREKEEREAAAARSGEVSAGQSSCGAVFRWLVTLQDGEGGGNGGRDIELVVGGVDDDDDDIDGEEKRRRKFMEKGGVRNSRRHVFDDLEIVDNRISLKDSGGGGGGGGGGDQEARVSICVPPKNALLLMRCRSDPVQMEALTSKFWESPTRPNDDVDEGDEEAVAEAMVERVVDDDDDNELFKECEVEQVEERILMLDEVEENVGGDESNLEIEKENQEAVLEVNEEMEEEIEDVREEINEEIEDVREEINEEMEDVGEEIEDENMFLDCLFHEFLDCLYQEYGDEQVIENVEDPVQVEEEANAVADSGEDVIEELVKLESIEEEETQDQNFEDANEILISETSKLDEESLEEDVSKVKEELVKESELQENKVAALPDCLLLMMCEPKLSMEVSKETWVCSNDFIRRPTKKKPPLAIKPIDSGDDESTKKKINVDVPNKNPPPMMVYREPNPELYQPPRSSMATMIEEKLVNAMGFEPFVLTRCKSEPMRNVSKLVPETCFWKNRKLEPLRRAAAYGVSTAGLGF